MGAQERRRQVWAYENRIDSLLRRIPGMGEGAARKSLQEITVLRAALERLYRGRG